MKKLLIAVFYGFLFLLLSTIIGVIVTIEYDRPFIIRFAVGICSLCVLAMVIVIGFLISEGIEIYKEVKNR